MARFSYSVAKASEQPKRRASMRTAEALIRDQLPPSNWPAIPTLLRTAYRAAEEIIRDNPILQVKSAEDNRGRIIQWSVDLKVETAIKNGSLPCDYSWEYFDKPTGRYLQLRFPHSTASISQVSRPDRQPRSVVFRENARLRSQPVFEGFKMASKSPVFPIFSLFTATKILTLRTLLCRLRTRGSIMSSERPI